MLKWTCVEIKQITNILLFQPNQSHKQIWYSNTVAHLIIRGTRDGNTWEKYGLTTKLSRILDDISLSTETNSTV